MFRRISGRLMFTASGAGALVAASGAPAAAFQHDRVHNPVLHAALDVASLLIVLAPVWTAALWGRGAGARTLIALIALVQAPVAVLAFVPAASHGLKGAGLAVGLAVTVGAIAASRRAARERESTAQASSA